MESGQSQYPELGLWFAEGWEEKEVCVGLGVHCQFTDSQNVQLQTDRFSLGQSWEMCLKSLDGSGIKERTGFCRQGDGNTFSVLAGVCFNLQLQSLVDCALFRFQDIFRHEEFLM